MPGRGGAAGKSGRDRASAQAKAREQVDAGIEALVTYMLFKYPFTT
jgi:hypothetical protein